MNWNTIPSNEIIQKTAEALKPRGVSPLIVASKKEAMEQIISAIPKGASIMNGSSVTLEQIGFLNYLKSGNHNWHDLHKTVASENDPEKRAELRKQSSLSDYYLGSVHALTENGEFLIASNTGSQLPHVVYTSPNLIFVVGVQKIVPTLSDAFKRLEEYVVPLEDKHMKDLYGAGTQLSKLVIFKHENPHVGRKITMILVKEPLGF